MDQPTQIGNPNSSPETGNLVRPGALENTRSESGSSVSSGRGSLNNDCTIPDSPASWAEARENLARQGK